MKQRIVAVIGAGAADDTALGIAEEVGRLIAAAEGILLSGGLGGVMEAAARGAHAAGGITVGILPEADITTANRYITVPVATGLGEGRNVVIARTADALIAIGGEYGTLSEIAFGLKMGKPVIGIGTWDIPGVIAARDPEEAVKKAFFPPPA